MTTTAFLPTATERTFCSSPPMMPSAKSSAKLRQFHPSSHGVNRRVIQTCGVGVKPKTARVEPGALEIPAQSHEAFAVLLPTTPAAKTVPKVQKAITPQ